MSLNCPLVSIGLPVYNGEQYIQETINSILDQTFGDFELNISDNASTDATGDICRDAAAQDPRVQYVRSEVNRGLAWNTNRVIGLARGRYVAWIGHDDLMARDYIAKCVAALDDDSGAVLCFAGYNYIDERGGLILRPPLYNPAAFETPSARFLHTIYEVGCHPIYGLMKAATLKQTGLQRGFAESDRVLLAEMALRGRFILVPEHLFSRREHPGRNFTKYRSLRERTLIFDPAKAGKLYFPLMLETAAFCSAIRRAPVPFTERLQCYRSLLGWLWVKRAKDLLIRLRRRTLSRMRKFLSEDQVRLLKNAKSRLLRSWQGRVEATSD
jgi:glycosyltransferase involved in cell wall biosynthesis